MNDKVDYDLYVLSEIAYKDKHKLENEEDIFPDGWYSSTDYKLKVEIIAQAIENDLLIKETALYKESILKGLFN